VEIRVIRNPVSWPIADVPPPLNVPVVIAAGRLSSRKGFLRLVRAFAPVAAAQPDWQLHTYGQGEKRKAIRQLVRRLGLQSQVRLHGYTRDLPSAMRQASVYAMASRWEGFPMVLIEAMSVGLPVVAFDCPRGPGEVVRHGANGILIENDRLRAFSRGLLTLVEDVQLRRSMGHQALDDAHGFTADAIAADWTQLIDDLDTARRGTSTGTAPILHPAGVTDQPWPDVVGRARARRVKRTTTKAMAVPRPPVSVEVRLRVILPARDAPVGRGRPGPRARPGMNG
jgi:glycosyltransferase involved in cell wall biosynthesis